MKKIISGILIIIATNIYSQSDTLVSSLRGLEDINGKTHLFYNAKFVNFAENTDSTIYFLYNYTEGGGGEKLLYKGYSVSNAPENSYEYNTVKSIEFINGNPRKYILLTVSNNLGEHWSISRYDTANVLNGSGRAEALFISKQDTNRVFIVTENKIFISEDGGYTITDSVINIQFKYLSFYPYDDKIIFGVNENGNLVKSFDRGKTFIVADQSVDWNYADTLLFDRDGQHLYAIYNKRSVSGIYTSVDSYLLVSDDKGNPYTWEVKQVKYAKSNICIDDSASGVIFYTEGGEIYKSEDYGNTFQLYGETYNFPAGMYKKPGEEVLFIANTHGISKIVNDSTEMVVRKSVKQSLTYYPLQVGNKWVYGSSGYVYDPYFQYFDGYIVYEISTDSLFTNGKRYYCLAEIGSGGKQWLRLDSLTGKLYEYRHGDELLEDFTATSGDTFETLTGILNEVVDSDTFLWNKKRLTKMFHYSSLYTYQQKYVQGIGIVYWENEFDFGHSTDTLQGCIINGIVYGDTTVTAIKGEENPVPKKFALYQNYPNPFNPATTIKYSIPAPRRTSSSQGEGVREELYVSLKIYDVLGREILTLVNEKQAPGNYQVTFSAGNLPSGVYFYRLKAGNFVQTKRMVILK